MKMKKIITWIFASLMFLIPLSAQEESNLQVELRTEDSYESRLYENRETGFKSLIHDGADLFTDAEEKALLDELIPITQWGNVCVQTVDDSRGMSAATLARTLYDNTFMPETSGTLFLIDMDNRELRIHSDGDVYKIINNSYANSITDNVYKMASAGDYYDCVSAAFKQIGTLLDGGKITQPMKHISNALIALMLALIICYIYMKKSPKTKDEKSQPRPEPVFNGALDNISVEKGHLRTRVIQSSSGGGSRGGGGGGHSGGGGGHRF